MSRLVDDVEHRLVGVVGFGSAPSGDDNSGGRSLLADRESPAVVVMEVDLRPTRVRVEQSHNYRGVRRIEVEFRSDPAVDAMGLVVRLDIQAHVTYRSGGELRSGSEAVVLNLGAHATPNSAPRAFVSQLDAGVRIYDRADARTVLTYVMPPALFQQFNIYGLRDQFRPPCNCEFLLSAT